MAKMVPRLSLPAMTGARRTPGDWVVDDGGYGRLPLSSDFADVDFLLADQIVNQSAPADGADDDCIDPVEAFVGVQQGGLLAGYVSDVATEVTGGVDYTRPIAVADEQGDGVAVINKPERAGRSHVGNVMRLAQGLQSMR